MFYIARSMFYIARYMFYIARSMFYITLSMFYIARSHVLHSTFTRSTYSFSFYIIHIRIITPKKMNTGADSDTAVIPLAAENR